MARWVCSIAWVGLGLVGCGRYTHTHLRVSKGMVGVSFLWFQKNILAFHHTPHDPDFESKMHIPFDVASCRIGDRFACSSFFTWSPCLRATRNHTDTHMPFGYPSFVLFFFFFGRPKGDQKLPFGWENAIPRLRLTYPYGCGSKRGQPQNGLPWEVDT